MVPSRVRTSSYFLRRFLDNPRTVGSLVPSSEHLADAMVGDLQVPSDRSVVELGPGTGAITRPLLARLKDSDQYVGIECDPAFVRLLGQRFPEADVRHDSAERMERLLRDGAIAPPRYIVSGMPFAALPLLQQYRVIRALRRVLPPDAEFRMFQYVHAWQLPGAVRFRRRMNQYFSVQSRRSCVFANLPPAMVLSWHAGVRERGAHADAADAAMDPADEPAMALAHGDSHVR
jgi:phosphatidylethanolamine/phosphatidyl-N-methylethanolamine N-methyltransferase